MSGHIGFGIVGCGVISRTHADAIQKAESGRLVAVCDILPDRARKLSDEYGARAYFSFSRMLKNPEVDAVCICTPSGMHAKVACQAAAAGKHVLSEKPMDITLRRCDAMIEACDQAGVTLAVIFQRRTLRIVHAVKEAIASGEIGELVHATLSQKLWRSQEYYDSGDWRGTWKLDGGGCLMNQGVHGIDLFQWMAGIPIHSICAKVGTLGHQRIEVEDVAVANIEFVNGALGCIDTTTCCYPEVLPIRYAFHGTKGTIILEGSEGMDLTAVVWQSLGNQPSKWQGVRDDTGDPAVSTHSSQAPVSKGSHFPQIQDFVWAIQQKRHPLVSGEDARTAVQIITSIYESSRRGRPVRLN